MRLIWIAYLFLSCFVAASCRKDPGGSSAGAKSPAKTGDANGRAPRVILLRDGGIYIAELPDGEPKLLFQYADRANSEILNARKGNELLYIHQAGLDEHEWWFLNLKNGKRTHLFNSQTSFALHPSPDGRWIASVGGGCTILEGPLSLLKMNGTLVKEFYGSSGESISQSVEFIWKPDGTRLYVLMRSFGSGTQSLPPSLREYKTPKMKGRDLSHNLPGGKEVGDAWVEEDGYIVLVAQGSETFLHAFHPDANETHQIRLVQAGPNAPGLNPHERYFIINGKLCNVQWDKGTIQECDAPPITSVGTAEGQFRMISFQVTRMNEREFLLIYRGKCKPPSMEECEYEIRLAPLGETETKIIFPGYQLGVLVD